MEKHDRAAEALLNALIREQEELDDDPAPGSNPWYQNPIAKVPWLLILAPFLVFLPRITSPEGFQKLTNNLLLLQGLAIQFWPSVALVLLVAFVWIKLDRDRYDADRKDEEQQAKREREELLRIKQERIRHLAEDQVASLLTLANMPWPMTRSVTEDSVDYGLVIPEEEKMPESPMISMGIEAAQYADLLILAIKHDQKMISTGTFAALEPQRTIYRISSS